MILLNGSPINVTIFPDKTSQVWHLDPEILNNSNYFHITWEFESEAEFMHLAQLKHLLDRTGYFKTSLRIKYLPYGRQDKPVSNDATFALTTFSRLLNGLNFDQVIIHDPHSNLAFEKYIINAEPVYPKEQVLEAYTKTESSVICYPDNGARVKYNDIYTELFNTGLPYIYGHKVRDQATGKILQYQLNGYIIKDQKVLIVDDLCDGGATFILLTKELYKAGAKEVNLFVSHGLFTNGLKPLLDSGIKRIFTKDGEVTTIVND